MKLIKSLIVSLILVIPFSMLVNYETNQGGFFSNPFVVIISLLAISIFGGWLGAKIYESRYILIGFIIGVILTVVWILLFGLLVGFCDSDSSPDCGLGALVGYILSSLNIIGGLIGGWIAKRRANH